MVLQNTSDLARSYPTSILSASKSGGLEIGLGQVWKKTNGEKKATGKRKIGERRAGKRKSGSQPDLTDDKTYFRYVVSEVRCGPSTS